MLMLRWGNRSLSMANMSDELSLIMTDWKAGFNIKINNFNRVRPRYIFIYDTLVGGNPGMRHPL